ncbi:hypothetical protein D3H65_20010 [Paraflavitalea soli]|uniref:Uncharacterized protein n=1 Tax=Paraflavitalea soli TaxID=2315862 RepID=A0A3B7MNQ8_9BACT|nr:hypothetical protein D3H65_20010 [Paraflavitalea soli]
MHFSGSKKTQNFDGNHKIVSGGAPDCSGHEKGFNSVLVMALLLGIEYTLLTESDNPKEVTPLVCDADKR